MSGGMSVRVMWPDVLARGAATGGDSLGFKVGRIYSTTLKSRGGLLCIGPPPPLLPHNLV